MSIFDFVKSKLDILDVVLEYVQMKRIGGYWKGSCPFHHEKDASFTVSPDKQIFYCFGCHAGGDLISFISKIENMSPIEAANHLIEKYSIEIPEELKKGFSKSTAKSGKKEQFFHTCESVAQWCHEQLLANKRAQDYLKDRKFGPSEWKRFSIGYFPSSRGMNNLLRPMASKNILVQDLVNAGIVAQGRSGVYSPFEERIIFPIRDSLGRCCGFGGRVFAAHDDRAKYYNSKDSELFSKGKLLFGLDLAKKEMQLSGKAFLVEGYTDCVAMAKHGYKNTVATLGTACTVHHLKNISRFSKVLYVLYDGDKAGQNAILRLTKLCWEANLELRIITLPSNQDPASFLDASSEDTPLKKLIGQSSDIFTFFVNSLGERFWEASLSEKMELCDKIVAVIAKIDYRSGDGARSRVGSFKQDVLLQQASSVMQVPFDTLKELLSRHREAPSAAKHPAHENSESMHAASAGERVEHSLEGQIASIVINSVSAVLAGKDGEKFTFVDKDLLPYFSHFIRSVLLKTEAFMEGIGEGKTFSDFLAFFESEAEREWIVRQSFMVEDESSATLLEKLQFRFRKKNWKRIVQDMRKQIFQAKQEDNRDKLQGLLDSFSALKLEMRQRGLI